MRQKGLRRIRIVVILLCLALLVGGYVFGAGRQDDEAAAVEAAGFNATGFPIMDDLTSYRVAIVDYWNTEDFNQKDMFQMWTEKTNIVFDMINMSGQEMQTRVPLMYSTDDLPDAFIGIGQAVNDDYGAQGLNIAVQDLIAAYGPNITKDLEEVPAAAKLVTAVDGNMYSIPRIDQANDSRVVYASFVRSSWLDRLGLDVPTNTDEFYDLLVEIKNADANGNGDANDEIPFSVRWEDGISGIRAWFHPFGTTSVFMGAVQMRDGEVFAPMLEPGYRDAIKWLHTLYAEELLDEEAFTYEISAYRAKAQQDVIGVASAWGGWNIVPEGSAAQAKEWWTPIPPLEGPDGITDAEFNPFAGINTQGMVITKEASVPEALVRYADLNFIGENAIQWNFGPLDYNLYKDDNGKIGFLPTPDEFTGYGQFRIAETNPFMVLGVTANWASENYLGSDRGEWKNYLVRDLYLPKATIATGATQTKLTAAELDEVNQYLVDISSYIQSKEAEWVVNGTIDDEWDAYLIRLEGMGLNRVLELYQEGAKRWGEL